MKNTNDNVIIKLYIEQIDDDVHDIRLDLYEKQRKRLQKYAKEHGKNIELYIPNNYSDMGDPTNFVEVLYNTEVTEEDKKFYKSVFDVFFVGGFLDDELDMFAIKYKCYYIKTQIDME